MDVDDSRIEVNASIETGTAPDLIRIPNLVPNEPQRALTEVHNELDLVLSHYIQSNYQHM